jgi:acyl-coenzyme A thioesterase 13
MLGNYLISRTAKSSSSVICANVTISPSRRRRHSFFRAHLQIILVAPSLLIGQLYQVAMAWNPALFLEPSLNLEERVKMLLFGLVNDPNNTGFDNIGSEVVELLSVSQNTQSIHYVLTVSPKLCNRGGNLHGGAAAALFDILTSIALLTVAKPGYWDMLGVSRTLTVTFLRPLPLGTKVFVDCEVVAAGKNLANLRGTMKTADGKVCITCTHDKVAVPSPKL